MSSARGARSDLIKQGLAAHCQGLYNVANASFQESRDLRFISGSESSSGDMPDETLTLWLALSKARKIHILKFSADSSWDRAWELAEPFGLRICYLSRSAGLCDIMQGCLDACLLAQIFLYVGDRPHAQHVLDLVLKRLLKLKGPYSSEYQGAVILMAEILYS